MAWRVKGGRTLGTGVRIATGAVRPRNDRVFTGSTGKCSAGGQGRPPLRITRSAVNRGVGEIGEALPVAEEASRFRGSAPIGGHNSGRQSVGTTVGKRTPPLRTAKKSLHQADRVVRPYKVMPCRAGPMCPAVPPYPLQKARHCETSANAGRGNPSSLPPGDRKGRPYAPSFRFPLST